MRELATMGLYVISGVSVLSLAMAYFENAVLTLLGTLLMIGIIAGGLWYVSNITITFF